MPAYYCHIELVVVHDEVPNNIGFSPGHWGLLCDIVSLNTSAFICYSIIIVTSDLPYSPDPLPWSPVLLHSNYVTTLEMSCWFWVGICATAIILIVAFPYWEHPLWSRELLPIIYTSISTIHSAITVTTTWVDTGPKEPTYKVTLSNWKIISKSISSNFSDHDQGHFLASQ